MVNFSVHGVIVPMLTPFDAHGQVDEAAARALVNYLIERGVAALFPLGTTGEGPLLSTDERQRLAEIVIEAAAGRVPVIVHTGAITTAETLALTRHAHAVGASAVAVVPPYFFKLDEQALERHYREVAGQLPDLPVYLYNNPAVTPNVITLPLLERLVEVCPNICGLKDSSGSLALLAACRAKYGAAFNTAIGPDGLILAGLAMGLDATVSGNANFVPELVTALYAAATSGDLERARALQEKLDRVRAATGDGADLAMFKALVARRGVSIGSVRPPLKPVQPERVESCWQEVSALGIERATL